MKIKKGTYINTSNYGISFSKYDEGPLFFLVDFGRNYIEFEFGVWKNPPTLK